MSAAGSSQNNLGFQLCRGDDYGTKSAPQIVGRCVLRKVAAEISFTSFAIAERLLMLTTPLLNWRSIADFSVLTIVAYWLLNWARQTRVLRLLTGVGAMVLLGSLTGRLELEDPTRRVSGQQSSGARRTLFRQAILFVIDEKESPVFSAPHLGK